MSKLKSIDYGPTVYFVSFYFPKWLKVCNNILKFSGSVGLQQQQQQQQQQVNFQGIRNQMQQQQGQQQQQVQQQQVQQQPRPIMGGNILVQPRMPNPRMSLQQQQVVHFTMIFWIVFSVFNGPLFNLFLHFSKESFQFYNKFMWKNINPVLGVGIQTYDQEFILITTTPRL